MYCGHSTRGAAILVATILIYNLNSIFLPVFVSANPEPHVFWKFWLPRILHDLRAFSKVFWIWETFDAYQLSKGKAPSFT
jgi:hypothetical protein